MEICPRCGRHVRTAKGWHYCEKVSLEQLFEGKQPQVSDLFDALLLEVMDWENISFSATKNCIVFTHKKAFLVVKPMKKDLDIKFYLPEFLDVSPIYKCAAWSGKFETHVRLSTFDDLTPAVINFLRISYNL
jgi:hypothetical protein